MQSFPEDDRIKNFPPSEWQQGCVSCGDDGLVEVGFWREQSQQASAPATLRPEMGPCPFCLKGFRIESAAGKKARWGLDGFWRGREVPESLLRHWKQNQPLPPAENQRRMRELHERMALIQAGGGPGKPSWGWGDPKDVRSPFQPDDD